MEVITAEVTTERVTMQVTTQVTTEVTHYPTRTMARIARTSWNAWSWARERAI